MFQDFVKFLNDLQQLIGIFCFQCGVGQLSPVLALSSSHSAFPPKDGLCRKHRGCSDRSGQRMSLDNAPWQAGKPCPPRGLRSEVENDSSGWLRRVSPAVSVQGPESEVRILVHKTSVFGTQREVSAPGIISACSVQEGASSLSASPGNKPALVAGGIKDQTAAPSERVSTDPSNVEWKVHHQIPSYCVHVGLDSGFSETSKVFLSVSVETIIPFRREPTVDVITVPHGESAGV